MLSHIYDEISTKPFTLGSIEEMKFFFGIVAKYMSVEDKESPSTN